MNIFLTIRSSLAAQCVVGLLLLTAGSLDAAAQGKENGYVIKTPTRDGTGKFYMGREIALVMGASGTSWLERSSRQREENSNLAISKFPLAANSVVADIGAGSGFYTFRVAAKVPQGKVYAVDIQEQMIRFLVNRKAELKAVNVEVVQGDTNSVNLPASSIDMAFMVDVYHELLYPKEMLQSIRNALRSGGKLVLLEYKAEDPSVGIKELHKMSVQQVTKELAANGFRLESHGDFLPIQHLLIFAKKP